MGETISSQCRDPLLGTPSTCSSVSSTLLSLLVTCQFLYLLPSSALDQQTRCSPMCELAISSRPSGLVRTTQLPTSLSKQLRTLAGVCPQLWKHWSRVGGRRLIWLTKIQIFVLPTEFPRASRCACGPCSGWLSWETRGPLPNHKGMPDSQGQYQRWREKYSGWCGPDERKIFDVLKCSFSFSEYVYFFCWLEGLFSKSPNGSKGLSPSLWDSLALSGILCHTAFLSLCFHFGVGEHCQKATLFMSFMFDGCLSSLE